MTEQTAPPKNDLDDYTFLSLAEATSPAGGMFFQHYVESWWLIHPEKGLAFFNPRIKGGPRKGRRRQPGVGAPQCNRSEQISRSVAASTCPWPDYEVHLVMSAWVPIRIEDYR